MATLSNATHMHKFICYTMLNQRQSIKVHAVSLITYVVRFHLSSTINNTILDVDVTRDRCWISLLNLTIDDQNNEYEFVETLRADENYVSFS